MMISHARNLTGSIPLIAVVLLVLTQNTTAQQRNPERGFQAGNSYAISDIENINLTNGNLIMTIPLGSVSAGRGAGPGHTVALAYNSTVELAAGTPDGRYPRRERRHQVHSRASQSVAARRLADKRHSAYARSCFAIEP